MPIGLRICGALGVELLVSLCGCASVMSGRHADVTVNTNVPQARVVVHDKRGQQVASAHAPASFALKRKDNYIFPGSYTATIHAPGYQPAEVPIDSTVNPWVLGNVIVGGPLGLVVDNVTGTAWKPKQSQIHRELRPLGVAHYATDAAPQMQDPRAQRVYRPY